MYKPIFIFLFLSFLMGCTSPAPVKKAAEYNAALGMEYLKMGENARAYEKLHQAFLENPKSISAHLSMAYYFEKNGDLKQARIFYQRALELAPHVGVVLNNYGVFLCKNGHKTLGIDYIKQAILDINYPNKKVLQQNIEYCK